MSTYNNPLLIAEEMNGPKEPNHPKQSSELVPAIGSAATWKMLALRMADEALTCLNNSHWEVKFGSGDLLTTIKSVREKYQIETQMPPAQR